MYRFQSTFLILMALLLSPMLGAVSPVAAQSGTSDVAIVATENGQSIYDACFVLVNFSNEGCDENGDGQITFQDVPLGTYTVTQTRDLGPGRSIPDTTINVTGATDGDGWERFYLTVSNSGGSSGQTSSSQGGSSDIAVVTTENGQPVYDACFILVSYSNEGCDRNGDGQITFEDVPLGTYTLRQTADLGPGRSLPDSTITVRGAAVSDGWERFYPEVLSNSSVVPGSGPIQGAVDISLITRDPNGGRLVTGTCYVLVDYSNEGCDENGDGQVTFDDVPAGTYTVRQTQTPAGYPTINAFPIVVDDTYPNVPVGYLVRQAVDQYAPGTRNVSVVFVDSRQDTKVVSSICVQFVGGSNVGCDRDLVDGQIDFLDVPQGTYPVEFSNVPAGWRVVNSIPSLTVGSGTGPQIVYVAVDATGTGSGSGTTTESGAIAVVGGVQPNTAPGGTSSTDSTSGSAAVELILDTSGSMNERDQGTQTRLEVAKTVTTRLVTETLPAGSTMGLRTYSGCSSSLAIPLQPLDPTTATATINGLRATGQTPIGQSLRAAAADLTNVNGPKIIVLVTDGEETCGGDPRQAIAALVAQDITIQVNIVGFAIDDATLTETFREWARVGNGTYYQASNELELNQAVITATQLSFDVINQQGSVIASGTVGGDAVSVPVGTYTVEVDTVPATRYENIIVGAQGITTIDLTTGGTSGSGTGGQNGNQGQNTQVIVPTNNTQGTTTQSGVTSTSTGSATLLMTFRACPEGFTPATGDYFADCTIPLDAPDASFLYHGGDGQGGQNIAWMDRQYNGAYIFNAGPQTMSLQLSGLAPVVRNAYQVIGADSGNGSTFTVNLVDGETREVFIFYYFA